jgi:hypothetical protein
VRRAVELLQPLAGPSYPMLFLQLGVTPWTPVGEEMWHKVIPGKGGTAAVVICDEYGNSKAMSGWILASKADEVSKTLGSKKVLEYPGDVKLPV